VKAALKKGAEINKIDSEETTPLMSACIMAENESRGHIFVVDHLIQAKADINFTNSKNDSALTLCAKWNHHVVLKSLVKAKPELHQLNIALLPAIMNGYHKVVRILLEAKATVDIKNVEEDPILFLAVASQSKRGDRITTIRNLIHGKADINLRASCGLTPLMYAADHGDNEAVLTLLESKLRGLELKEPVGGNTALLMACASTSNDRTGVVKVVRCLVEAKANFEAKNKLGNTPLILAASSRKSRVVRYLMESKADPAVANSGGKTADPKVLNWALESLKKDQSYASSMISQSRAEEAGTVSRVNLQASSRTVGYIKHAMSLPSKSPGGHSRGTSLARSPQDLRTTTSRTNTPKTATSRMNTPPRRAHTRNLTKGSSASVLSALGV